METTAIQQANHAPVVASSISQPPGREQILDHIQAFYDHGQYLKAWALSKTIGPLKHWQGSREMVLAGRLAFNLGSRRLGNVLHRLALRKYPNDPRVITFAMLTMSSRLGPWQTLQRMKLHGDMQQASVDNQSDWLALKALNYAQLRDFQKAEYWQAKAFELAPKSPWMYVTLASILEYQDRLDEATEAAEQAVKLKPTYRPAIQTLANRYIESNRDKDAVSILFKAIKEIESGLVRCQLASFYRELEYYEHAMQLYSGIEKFFPLLSEDSKYEQWLAGVLSDLHHLNGNRKTALKFAKAVDDDEFYSNFAKRLGNESFVGKRVQLPVQYVKQHHVTCAPATLTAIADYWKKGIDHLDIVEKICYDGTPGYSERRWAAQNGFKTVEFTLTWEAATALIDGGMPFTLTTIEPGNGHLQPIIGYDSFRKTLITRDPGNRHASEFVFDKMKERYASTGPRGMALVPTEHAERLEGINFEDAKEYDLLFNVELCLEKHNREKADEIVSLMEQHFPENRLTLRGRTSVARYDSDTQTMLTAVDKLLEQYPEDVNFQLQKLGCLHELGRREDRLATLQAIRHSDKCHPLFWTRLASELADDAREEDEVNYLLSRSIRYRYYDGYGFYLLGCMKRDRREDEEALELFRISACLDDMNEHRAHAYFSVAQSMNRMNEAMELLEDRISRFGTKSPSPVMTLASAHEEMDQPERSFEVLSKGMEHHGSDGNFLLYYSNFCSRYGRNDEARALLTKAEAHAGRQDWLHNMAHFASRSGEPERALECLEELIEADPLNAKAHSHALTLVADRDGPAVAISRIRKYVEQFPSSYALRKLLIDWLYRERMDVREIEIKTFLEIHPSDAWALRELASLSADMKKFEQAAAAIEQACEVEPNSPATYGFRGEVYKKQNRFSEAMGSFRKALTIAIDYQYAIHELMSCCSNREQRQQQLDFILSELNRQTSRGDGLLIYRSYAKQVLEPEQLLQTLLDFLARRQDQWQAWVALSRQLSDMQRHEQATSMAARATDKFPLLPRTWVELAKTWSACGEWDKQIECLKQANSINSSWGEVIRELSEAYDKKGELELAQLEIEKAIKLDPRNPVNFGYLADLMWRHGDRDDALEKIAHAVRLDPDYDFAWSALRSWCETLGKPDYDVEVANELCKERPDEARSWLKLAFCLDQPHQVDDAIEAIDKALAIEPFMISAYSQKANLHCSLGRFDKARQVLATEAFGENYPVELAVQGACVTADEGNLKGALDQLMAIVEKDPDYFKAWQMIADWAGDLELKELYNRAAKNMTRLEPQYHIAWGYLAEAAAESKNVAEAKSHLMQAIQLSPDYSYATGKLLELHLEDEEYDEAIRVVDIAAPHVSTEARFSKLIQIESMRGDRMAALSYFEEFASVETDDIEALAEATCHLQRANWNEDALETLERLLAEPESLPAVADAFAFQAGCMEKWTLLESKLNHLRSNRKYWDIISSRLLQCLQDRGEFQMFFGFIDQESDFIRASNDGWQNIGWLLLNVNLYGQCIEWMHDWKVRPEAEAWALCNLATSLFCTQKDHQALEVAEAALSKENYPPAIADRLKALVGNHWLAYGDAKQAFEVLSMVNSDSLPSLHAFLYFQAMAAAEAVLGGKSFAESKAELQNMFDMLDESHDSDRPIFERNMDLLLWSIARRQGKALRAAWLKRKAKALA